MNKLTKTVGYHILERFTREFGEGYTVARHLEAISVAEIISAVDESVDATQCGGRENCHDEGRCSTHDLWGELKRHIFDYLGAVTLSQRVEKQQLRQSGAVAAQLSAQLSDMREVLPLRQRAAI